MSRYHRSFTAETLYYAVAARRPRYPLKASNRMHIKKLLGATTVAFMLMTGVAMAQTTDTGTGVTDATGTTLDATGAGTGAAAGVPNTGAGGAVLVTGAMLAAAAALAAGSAAYLRRKQAL